jgi:hypothetical protein
MAIDSDRLVARAWRSRGRTRIGENRVTSGLPTMGGPVMRRRRTGVWAWLEILAFLLLCSLGPLAAGWEVRNWGNLLSPADANSEGNVLREVDGFRAEGLTKNAVLGNVLYGDKYLAYGFAAPGRQRESSVTPSGVYTHYPPGPEYMLFASEALLGPEPLSRLRLVPLALCWAATVFFGLSIRRRFGPDVGWLVFAACTVQPLFSDADIHLHNVGYAFALLLVELGLCFRETATRWPYLLVGFLQGWLSFDYVFLVVLSPFAIAVVMPQLVPGAVRRVRVGIVRSLTVGVGFVVAHAMHLLQVWAFFGSLALALADLGGAARWRAGAAVGSHWTSLVYNEVFVGVMYLIGNHPISPWLWHYAAQEDPDYHVFRAFGFAPVIAWLAATVALYIASRLLVHRGKAMRGRLLLDWFAVSGVGLAVSSVWIAVMIQHSEQHWPILCRHLFFAYFLCAIFLAVRWEMWRTAGVFASEQNSASLSPSRENNGVACPQPSGQAA